MRNEATAVLIPAYEPDWKLVDLVQKLCQEYRYVLVVNDGSSRGLNVFDEVRKENVTVLVHERNRGKGAALKTGFRYVIENWPDVTGVVTADADGQHRVEDIGKVAEAVSADDRGIVLGVRSFSGDVPFRSRLGNSCTRWLFFIMTGLFVRDTQTGLRGIPRPLLARMLQLEGERYEYEMQMLADAKRHERKPVQVDIATVYIEENASSHFNPIKDSILIWSALFKFCFSGVTSFLLDNLLFSFVVWALKAMGHGTANAITGAMVCARFISANYNYLCNRYFVFNGSGSRNSYWQYWGLACFIGLCSWGATEFITKILGLEGFAITVAKILADFILFFLSYVVQKKFIFKR